MNNGPQKILDMAVAMGIPRKHPRRSRPTTRIALGRPPVSPINMANAYATIANGGVHHDVFT